MLSHMSSRDTAIVQEPLLTKAEVRDRLNVSRATLDRIIRAGDLAVIKLGDGPKAGVRIRPEAVEAYLAARSAA